MTKTVEGVERQIRRDPLTSKKVELPALKFTNPQATPPPRIELVARFWDSTGAALTDRETRSEASSRHKNAAGCIQVIWKNSSEPFR
jgi:hypothetical protein